MADGPKPDVPTTDRQNEKKKKHRPFYEAVDAHARRHLKKKHRVFYEAVDAHARCRLIRQETLLQIVCLHPRIKTGCSERDLCEVRKVRAKREMHS